MSDFEAGVSVEAREAARQGMWSTSENGSTSFAGLADAALDGAWPVWVRDIATDAERWADTLKPANEYWLGVIEGLRGFAELLRSGLPDPEGQK